MTAVHDFNDCLARSHAYEDAPWWEEIYRQAFPGLAGMVSTREYGWAQYGGIDRVLTLRSGKTLTVDEKVRERDYNDILLETWSDLNRRKPGWMQKELAIDYLAYAFAPSQQCYLFPFPLLRRAWLNNGQEWLRLARDGLGGYSFVDAQNNGYVTRSVGVPKDDLLSAIRGSMIVTWGQS